MAETVNVLPLGCQTVTVWPVQFQLGPMTSGGLFPDRKKGPYYVRIHWGVIAGRAEPIGLEVWSVRPTDLDEDNPLPLPPADAARQAVSVADLRTLRLGEVIDKARATIGAKYLAWRREHPNEEPTPQQLAGGWVEWTLDRMIAADARPFAEKPRKGTDVPPDEYRRVADVYKQAWSDGRNPREAVAEQFHISLDAAAKRIQRARERNLLPPTSRGVAAAVPPRKRSRRKADG